jgi:hypothetical protein
MIKRKDGKRKWKEGRKLIMCDKDRENELNIDLQIHSNYSTVSLL